MVYTLREFTTPWSLTNIEHTINIIITILIIINYMLSIEDSITR